MALALEVVVVEERQAPNPQWSRVCPSLQCGMRIISPPSDGHRRAHALLRPHRAQGTSRPLTACPTIRYDRVSTIRSYRSALVRRRPAARRRRRPSQGRRIPTMAPLRLYRRRLQGHSITPTRPTLSHHLRSTAPSFPLTSTLSPHRRALIIWVPRLPRPSKGRSINSVTRY